MILRGGSAVVRLPQSGLQRGRTGFNSSHLQRVASLHHSFQSRNILNLLLRGDLQKSTLCRMYATRPVSRPKAHTGRTTTAARKAPTTSKTKAAKKPAAKKTTPKARPTAKSTAKPRPKAKRKPAKKTKAKSKSKRPVFTEAQQKARTIKDLKAIALQPPNGGPSTAWMVFVMEGIKGSHVGGTGPFTARMKELSAQFKELSPEQLEHYNHIANQNKAANDTAYRQWIESHTPMVIYAANVARRNLKKLGAKGYKTVLQDHRQVKRPKSSYTLFYTERYSSGDFKGLKATEAAKLAGREWKALSADEKKPYEDSAKQDLARYTQEQKTVYNKDVRVKPQAAAAA